ncbi:neural cell adhesion molecule L1-like protein [Haliotis rubra]|uniref:neural cell adhesion molecule L1-like protein n=1 Tax=Haliotis rubra TaxID=36100 RepID=UPI001EE61C25|nr:neural cell adhesion molecule L1-like protein [Haliotis rubra]
MSPTVTLFCFLVSLHNVASQGKPPDITDPPVQQIKYIVEHGNFTFTCKADGNPAPKYKWYVDGKEIESGKYQKVNADSGVLEIPDFSRREAGDYRCGATNNISQGVSPLAISPAISLKEIQQATGWSESDDIKDVRATEGDYAKLECNNVTQGDPKHPFSWFLKSSSADQLQASDRTYIDERGTLHFIYVEVSDKTSDDDVYNCAIYNKVREYIKLGNPKRLTVTKHTGSRERKPKKQFQTNPAEFPIGQTADLECVFSGYPRPSIYWFDTKNEPISPGTKYQMDGHNMKLKITKITEKDEGNYRCKGENAQGEAEATIFLDVKSAPIWEKAITNLTVQEGKDASFTCKARPSIGETALKPPVWYKNWEKIEGNTGNFLFSEKGRVLTVTQLTKPDDIMCFQCQITNDVGSVFSNGCLNVIKPIIVTTQPLLRQAIMKGDLVNLTVRGTTDPGMTLRYRWEFKTQTYYTELPPYVTYDDATNQTYINTTSLSDEEYEQIHGNYTSLLYHDFANRSVVITVVPRRDPAPAVLQAAGFPWWVIVMVAMFVVILVIVVVSVIMSRRQDEGAYKIYKTELDATYLQPDKDIQEGKFQEVTKIEYTDPFDGKINENM